MSRAAIEDGLNRFQRYRDARRRRGLRLARLWVPDATTPGFAQEAARQAALLQRADEEIDALVFIEQAADMSRR